MDMSLTPSCWELCNAAVCSPLDLHFSRLNKTSHLSFFLYWSSPMLMTSVLLRSPGCGLSRSLWHGGMSKIFWIPCKECWEDWLCSCSYSPGCCGTCLLAAHVLPNETQRSRETFLQSCYKPQQFLGSIIARSGLNDCYEVPIGLSQQSINVPWDCKPASSAVFFPQRHVF